MNNKKFMAKSTTLEALEMVSKDMVTLMEKIKELEPTQKLLAFCLFVEMCRETVKKYDEDTK